MDRPRMVAERAALAASKRGLDFAENGQGDFLGRFSANVEADGAEQACGLLIAYQSAGFEIVVPGRRSGNCAAFNIAGRICRT